MLDFALISDHFCLFSRQSDKKIKSKVLLYALSLCLASRDKVGSYRRLQSSCFELLPFLLAKTYFLCVFLPFLCYCLVCRWC